MSFNSGSRKGSTIQPQQFDWQIIVNTYSCFVKKNNYYDIAITDFQCYCLIELKCGENVMGKKFLSTFVLVSFAIISMNSEVRADGCCEPESIDPICECTPYCCNVYSDGGQWKQTLVNANCINWGGGGGSDGKATAWFKYMDCDFSITPCASGPPVGCDKCRQKTECGFSFLNWFYSWDACNNNPSIPDQYQDKCP
jgi:hypothetical protein